MDPGRVVSLAAIAMPHSDHCGLTLIRHGRSPKNIASSDELPPVVDDLQARAGQGPCVDAAIDEPLVRADDLSTDRRWPVFAQACVPETGVRSMLSVRLPVSGNDHAAINWYSRTPFAFGDDDVATSSLLAPYAAVAVEAHLRTVDVANLGRALTTSRTIGVAVGIIMATRRVDEYDAFDLLRHASMDLNIKLREVAAQVGLTGELPCSDRST